MSDETTTTRPYEVTFTNAINGSHFTRRYDSQEEAEDAARTERPFNNTRTDVRAVSGALTPDDPIQRGI